LPTQSHPDFQTLHPNPGDIVLAVNFFGVRTNSAWCDWFAQHSDCILIEDHSHDPFSDWAKQSRAHYAIASLRKTLPLPDGAMLWSPQQLLIPQPSASPSKGAEYKLSAMVLKQAYLRGAELSKTAYRSLQIQGEQLLFDEMNARASDVSIALLPYLDIDQFQQQRRSNIEQFLALSSELDQSDWHPLFQSWNPGSTPFNAVIVCRNQTYRNSMRHYLMSRNIFTAVHWQQPATALDSLAVELSNRILTIPVDQRYRSDDIQQMIDALSSFEELTV
jgi:dTDP-4-amino-4,6-dideoxygalactose transaminase